jgi:predicted metal-dependent hydrolase
LYCDDLSVSENCTTKKNAIDHAVFLFNIERYWKSHEVLEGIWKKSSGTEKSILNGIILINAAFVHYQKNELDIFISILRRSLEKLSESLGKFYGLDLNQIKEEVTKIVIDKNSRHNFKIFLYEE